MSAARDADNLSAENMDGTKNNGKIKIEALRGTYVGLKWIGVNKKNKVGWLAIKFKTIFGYLRPDDTKLAGQTRRQGRKWRKRTSQ
jgi:hypothetical protein